MVMKLNLLLSRALDDLKAEIQRVQQEKGHVEGPIKTDFGEFLYNLYLAII